MEVIELARDARGQELIDIIRKTAEEQGFKFSEPDKYTSEYAVWRSCPEFDSFKGRAFDTCPSLTLYFTDLTLEKHYQRLQCRTDVATMRKNPVRLEGEFAQYKPFYDQFVDGINAKLRPETPNRS